MPQESNHDAAACFHRSNIRNQQMEVTVIITVSILKILRAFFRTNIEKSKEFFIFFSQYVVRFRKELGRIQI